MSFLDSVLGSSSDSDPTSSNPAVPGGIGKPLMIALLALLAKYMTSGSAASGSADPTPASASPAEASPGDVLAAWEACSSNSNRTVLVIPPPSHLPFA